jgi:zinc protease
MKKLNFFIALLAIVHSSNFIFAEQHVFKQVLENGLTILVRPVNTLDKVSMQVWYNVGSKDEKSGEKGLAHLFEHMLFGGTDILSESDLAMIAQKISADLNADTSYDRTRYYFNVPEQYWKDLMPILASCMSSCSIKEDKLNSELKVVIQELKRAKDNYTSELFQKLLSAIFPDHPYHYPIIGYKQDLWNLSRESLVEFYKKHYGPNNAVLVVVGNVDPQEVFAQAQEHFGPLEPLENYKKQEFYLNKDIEAKTVTIYRDANRPKVMLAYVVPGSKEKLDFELELLQTALTGGKESRLHKKLVDELKLVNWIGSQSIGLQEYDLFGFFFEPVKAENIESIIEHIKQEIEDIQQNGITHKEFLKTHKNIKSSFYSLLESNYEQATAIGDCYLVTGDPEYIFKKDEQNYEVVNNSLKKICQDYLRPTIMHKGYLLPLPESEREHWLALQERSDQEDKRILEGRVRDTEIEEGNYIHKISIKPFGDRTFIYPHKYELSNGIKVFYHSNTNIPKITLILSFKANPDYEPSDKAGLVHLLNYMLLEGGTQNYTAEQLADFIESHGMSLHASVGSISLTMLSEDFEKGLDILLEVVSKAVFDKDALKKVRQWALADYQRFCDNPVLVGRQLVNEYLYKGHPYGKNMLTPETIEKIKRSDIKKFYQQFFTPDQTRIALSGDLTTYDVPSLLEQKLGSWQGPKVQELEYPKLSECQPKTINSYMNRDQVFIAFAKHSVDRYHEDFYKLLLFDQMLGKGLNSILFRIREKTGIFYDINGSVLSWSCKQPGLCFVSTLVSKDRLKEAKDVILKTLKEAPNLITEQNLIEAKQTLLHDSIVYYSKNLSIAECFLFLDEYNLPVDYFEKRQEMFEKITLQEVKQAARKVLNVDKLSIFQVGRIEE